MSTGDFLFTSESVTEGHPDKMADQISDAVLDSILKQDPEGRVACETLLTTGLIFVAGEITTNCYVDIPKVARETVRNIGYTRAKFGFDADTCSVITAIDEQSSDIAMGVNAALEARGGETQAPVLGAGDQGMMFGFACTETPELMPLPIIMAHKLALRLTAVRRNKELTYLRPDGKTQVSVQYKNGKPAWIDTIVISTQHHADVPLPTIAEDMKQHVIEAIVPQRYITDKTRILVNPTGRFVTGGPQGDTGLTGRKIIVDTYGGYARHGGGAFSGKDPTKVDRSATYAARYVAKNVVAAGLADKCEVQLAYAIGVAQPVSLMIETYGTGKVSDSVIVELIRNHFDLTPSGIISSLDLRRPIYREIAAYGHFGRSDLDLTWERVDKAVILRQEAGLPGEPTLPIADAAATI